MKNTTILLVIDPDTSDAVIADIANDAFQAQIHLNCLMIGSAPALPVYAYGTPPYGGMNIPDDWGKELNATRKILTDRQAKIKGLLAHSGVSADVNSQMCAIIDIKTLVAQHARVCDIAYIATDRTGLKREATHGVLFQSPIGAMINASPAKQMDHVFVAWNNSEAASAAVHAALPYLRAAKAVTVACFDPVATSQHDGAEPGADVAAWLSHHGCNVTVSQYPTGGVEVAQCIQDRASEIGADMVVMGAYGHSRVMEAMFGGTTRTMMEQSEIAVLFAH